MQLHSRKRNALVGPLICVVFSVFVWTGNAQGASTLPPAQQQCVDTYHEKVATCVQTMLVSNPDQTPNSGKCVKQHMVERIKCLAATGLEISPPRKYCAI